MAPMLNSSLAQRLLIFLFSCVAVARADEHWVTYKDCRYLPNVANDGDSFHVRAAGREYIFRLYFVDAPETDMRIPDRVAEQAKYFHVTIQDGTPDRTRSRALHPEEALAPLHHPHPQTGCPRPKPASALLCLCANRDRRPWRAIDRQRARPRLWGGFRSRPA